MQRSWAVAWRNLRRNRRRNLATVAAIAMGYGGLVVLGGYATRVEHFLRTNAVYLQHSGHVAVFKRGGLARASAEPEKYQLTPAEVQQVQALVSADPRVEFSARYLRGVGLAGNGCDSHPAFLLGVESALLGRIIDHEEVKRWSPEIAAPGAGRWLHNYPEMPAAAAITGGLATLLQKPKVYDETRGLPPAPRVLSCGTDKEQAELAMDADVQLISMTYDGMLNAVDAQAVAHFHAAEAAAEDGSVVATLEQLQKLFGTDRVTYLGVFLRDRGDAPDVARALQAQLDKAGMAVDAVRYDDENWNPYYVGTMAFLGSMISFITLLVALVLVLTVLGAMTLTILERTREIGTWRALGFGRPVVIGLVVREALLIALIGLLAGLALGLAASAGINAANIQFAPPGVPGTIQLLIIPSAAICALQAALLVPGVCVAAFLVVRAQVRRGVVDLLTAQSG